MDKIDISLIKWLQEDGRMTVSDLSGEIIVKPTQYFG